MVRGCVCLYDMGAYGDDAAPVGDGGAEEEAADAA